MSYELLILVFLLMVFWSFMTIFVIKAMFSLFNSVRPEGSSEIKLSDMDVFRVKMPKRKTKEQREAEKEAAEERRRYEIIMRNLEAFDGTGIGQEEVR